MIDGLININKPEGYTSQDVVSIVKKIFKVKKAGHFGTLDPLAKGVLLIGLGRATKFFNFYIKKRKVYTGVVRFGYSTTTYDREGEKLGDDIDININDVDFEKIINRFKGEIEQLPPIYSAKKINGKPLYKYARKNEKVEVKPIKVNIYSFDYKIIDNKRLYFEVETSSGTYIRTLAHDLGQVVGSGAFLESLTRTKIGEFSVNDSMTIDKLKSQMNIEEIVKFVIPIEKLLPEFTKILVNENGKNLVLNGAIITKEDVIKIEESINSSDIVRIFTIDEKLIAIAKKDILKKGFKPFIVFKS